MAVVESVHFSHSRFHPGYAREQDHLFLHHVRAKFLGQILEDFVNLE